jgi:hypothetical protein
MWPFVHEFVHSYYWVSQLTQHSGIDGMIPSTIVQTAVAANVSTTDGSLTGGFARLIGGDVLGMGWLGILLVAGAFVFFL